MPIDVTVDRQPRPLLPAVGKGLRCRCPKCGEGKLFRSFLKVNDECPVCGEELHHHKADDLPPYISIIIFGHILVGAMLHMEMTMTIAPYVYLLTLAPLAVILPLAMLPSIKGAVVGLQWANYMHGFDPTFRDPAAPDAI
ncbi:DUF983 domain-containing protein [Devosia sp.]|uniref:DUF983 domain-containing protein n=1 Tax=Devosia sp. TaxID=1871048 RepID=UPI002F02FD3C